MPTTHRSQPRTARRAAAVAALLGGLAAIAAPAAAAPPQPDATLVSTSGTATDDNDVYGRLDIAKARDRVTQVNAAHYVVDYRIDTYAPFRSQLLDGRDRYFDIELDRDGVAGAERTVLIATRAGALRALVTATASGRVVATLPAWRPNDHAIVVSGPRRILGAREYLWTSDFHTDRSTRCGWDGGVPLICQDSAPDRGWLLLQRPAWPGRR
jgi:hypothetical protein